MAQRMVGLQILIQRLQYVPGKRHPLDLFFQDGVPSDLQQIPMSLEAITLGPIFEALGDYVANLYPKAVDEQGNIVDRELFQKICGIFYFMFDFHGAASASGQNINPLCQEILAQVLTEVMPRTSAFKAA